MSEDYIEYDIEFDILNASEYFGTDREKANDLFNDEFIKMIESHGVWYGGGCNPGHYAGVLDFSDIDKERLDEKIVDVQRWLLCHSAKIVLRYWKKCEYDDET